MDNAPNYVCSLVRYPKEIHFSKNSSNQRYTNHIMIFCLRLRIVCTILDTCGAYFVSGSSKTKLRYFLAYFQVSFLLTFLRNLKQYFLKNVSCIIFSNTTGKNVHILYGMKKKELSFHLK